MRFKASLDVKMNASVWIPFWTVFQREVRRFLKVIFQTIATPLISSSLYLLIFGVSIGREIEVGHGISYLAFLIPGLVMMTTLRNSLDNASGSIVTSKFVGELEDLRMAPLSASQIAWGNGLAAIFRGVIVGLITLGVGFLFFWVMEERVYQIEHPGILFVFLFIGGMAFANLGLAMCMLATNFEQVSAINTFILLPLIYLGGVFFSLEQLHPFWQILSQFNPLLYMVNGVRYGMLGVSDVGVWKSFLVTLFTWICFYSLAIWSLKKGSYKRW
ncbi:MAG: Inner membrane transport permease YadH [Chlamydiae bacterium]|nr:Inner membrane transport permease YadH [Chlamydiota bacterium]